MFLINCSYNSLNFASLKLIYACLFQVFHSKEFYCILSGHVTIHRCLFLFKPSEVPVVYKLFCDNMKGYSKNCKDLPYLINRVLKFERLVTEKCVCP